MAEEEEKKQGFVLRKKEKKPETQENAKTESSQPAKKKIVIKKKNPNANGDGKSDSNTDERAKNGVHVVVKKTAPAPSAAQKPSEQQEKPRTEPAKNDTARPAKPFELNSARPNVKAGNLSDKRQGGYNRDRNGYNGNRGGYGQNGGRSLSEP